MSSLLPLRFLLLLYLHKTTNVQSFTVCNDPDECNNFTCDPDTECTLLCASYACTGIIDGSAAIALSISSNGDYGVYDAIIKCPDDSTTHDKCYVGGTHSTDTSQVNSTIIQAKEGYNDVTTQCQSSNPTCFNNVIIQCGYDYLSTCQVSDNVNDQTCVNTGQGSRRCENFLVTANPTSNPVSGGSTITSEPATKSPTTDNPTTAVPTTASPTTAAPTTSNPSTSNPSTSILTTNIPTTSAPVTSQPTSNSPTTNSPTSAYPTTSPPTTTDPTPNPASTTSPSRAPETSSPTTASPSTSLPTSTNPTTMTPTTMTPTTMDPTSSPSTNPITKQPTTIMPTSATLVTSNFSLTVNLNGNLSNSDISKVINETIKDYITKTLSISYSYTLEFDIVNNEDGTLTVTVLIISGDEIPINEGVLVGQTEENLKLAEFGDGKVKENPTTTESAAFQGETSKVIGTDMIMYVVIGAMVVILCIIGIIVYIVIRKRKHKEKLKNTKTHIELPQTTPQSDYTAENNTPLYNHTNNASNHSNQSNYFESANELEANLKTGPRRLHTMESEYTSDSNYRATYKQSFDNANVVDTMAGNIGENDDKGNHKRTVSEIIKADTIIEDEDEDEDYDEIVVTKGGPDDNELVNLRMNEYNQNNEENGDDGNEGHGEDIQIEYGEDIDVDDVENEDDDDDDVLSASLVVTKGGMGDDEEVFAFDNNNGDEEIIVEEDEIVINSDDEDEDIVTAGDNQ